MDWKIFSATFISVFIAEMGDKTQFAAVAAATNSKSVFSVWLAVVLALGIAGTLGILAGHYLGVFLSPAISRWISGILFVVIGIWILIR